MSTESSNGVGAIEGTIEVCGERVGVDGSADFNGGGTVRSGVFGCVVGTTSGLSRAESTINPTFGRKSFVLVATVSSLSAADAALIKTGDVCAGDGRSVARSDGEAGDMDVVRASRAATTSTVCAMGDSEDATH